jgi:hypothetical protein
MCQPTTPDQYPNADPLQMAFTELGSAVSCLHMETEHIFGPFEDACGPEGYIVNNQKWAKHAFEHIQAAREWMRKIKL